MFGEEPPDRSWSSSRSTPARTIAKAWPHDEVCKKRPRRLDVSENRRWVARSTMAEGVACRSNRHGRMPPSELEVVVGGIQALTMATSEIAIAHRGRMSSSGEGSC